MKLEILLKEIQNAETGGNKINMQEIVKIERDIRYNYETRDSMLMDYIWFGREYGY